MAVEKFNNVVSTAKVSVQIIATFLMAQAGLFCTMQKYWEALAFAGVAGLLLIVREFVVKRWQ